jgi:ubiquinone/menaquinone biosynthesis C-methylase UbiE
MTNNPDHRIDLERAFHESEDVLRDQNRLIWGLYESGVFDEAETYLLDALGNINGLDVLDFGCGSGGTMRRLLDRQATVTGFDLSYSRLDLARTWHNIPTVLASGCLVQASAELLPFADASFDIVIGKQILHHLDLDLAATEVKRVLRPGGRATFLEPLIHNPLLEGYRRLTPDLRSPTEQALAMSDLRRFSGHFTRWEHHEFCLFSVLPALLEAATKPSPIWRIPRTWLQKLDRRLADMFPVIGRYYWESVIILDR